MIACLLLEPGRELLADLHAFTDRIEPQAGHIFLELEQEEAKQLAQLYHCQAGLADSKEQAHLLALTALCDEVATNTQLIAGQALNLLLELDVSPKTVERLSWLGLTTLGELRRWSKTQLSAFLGSEAKLIGRYLKGPYSKIVAHYTPPRVLTESYVFDDPVTEPWQLTPVLEHLCQCLAATLDDKAAGKLTLQTTSNRLVFISSKLPKQTLRGRDRLSRLANLALHDCGALGFDIDRLELSLSKLYRPAKQVSLWHQKESVSKALERVEARFPRSLLAFKETNPYIPVSEFAFDLLPVGSEVKLEAPTYAFRRAAEVGKGGKRQRPTRVAHR